jgi:hypothetical protein
MNISTPFDPIRAEALLDAYDLLHRILIGYKFPWWAGLPIIGKRALRGYDKLYRIAHYIHVQALEGVESIGANPALEHQMSLSDRRRPKSFCSSQR